MNISPFQMFSQEFCQSAIQVSLFLYIYATLLGTFVNSLLEYELKLERQVRVVINFTHVVISIGISWFSCGRGVSIFLHTIDNNSSGP